MKREYTIQTLYETGQTLYYIDSDKVCRSMTITSITVYLKNDGSTTVWYSGDGYICLPESELFESPKAARQHVFGEIMKTSDEEL